MIRTDFHALQLCVRERHNKPKVLAGFGWRLPAILASRRALACSSVPWLRAGIGFSGAAYRRMSATDNGALQNCLPELAAHSRPAASALVVALVVKLTAAS